MLFIYDRVYICDIIIYTYVFSRASKPKQTNCRTKQTDKNQTDQNTTETKGVKTNLRNNNHEVSVAILVQAAALVLL